MKIDDLNPYERKETPDAIVLISVWDDLGNMEEKGLLKCDFCKKLFNYLEKRFD